MPQMMPINWLMLFMMFLITYMMFNVLNFFIYTPKMKLTENKKFTKKIMNWKW